MAAGAQTGRWTGPSRRRVPRFPMREALDVTVLREGILETVPGRSVNVCERGVSAVIAEELIPGEAVVVEVKLSGARPLLRARAIVRYHDKLRSGLEFVALAAEQREAIRNWAQQTKPASTQRAGRIGVAAGDVGFGDRRQSAAEIKRKRKKKFGGAWAVLIVLIAFVAGVFWWRWNRGWEELESELKSSQIVSVEKPQAQVPPEVMQKLLVHRVEPVYPAEARKANLQGIIALDVIVGHDGSVVGIRPLNGPEILARAAVDALRWWKFEPYRVNGEPACVETTVAVEFKK